MRNDKANVDRLDNEFSTLSFRTCLSSSTAWISPFSNGWVVAQAFRGLASRIRRRMNNELNFPPNFERLVLGCINADFCNQILSNTHFAAFFETYKICKPLHRSKFKISAKNRPQFLQIEYWIKLNFSICLTNFAILRRNFNEILSEFRDKFEKMERIYLKK